MVRVLILCLFAFFLSCGDDDPATSDASVDDAVAEVSEDTVPLWDSGDIGEASTEDATIDDLEVAEDLTVEPDLEVVDSGSD